MVSVVLVAVLLLVAARCTGALYLPPPLQSTVWTGSSAVPSGQRFLYPEERSSSPYGMSAHFQRTKSFGVAFGAGSLRAATAGYGYMRALYQVTSAARAPQASRSNPALPAG